MRRSIANHVQNLACRYNGGHLYAIRNTFFAINKTLRQNKYTKIMVNRIYLAYFIKTKLFIPLVIIKMNNFVQSI